MRKGFTLVELLIVVVVIVTLMTISFRIGGIGDETSKRNRTINRMQRLENCLSGYYAAYGSYPPVKLHGSRDYTLSVNGYGIQCADTDDHETELKWECVKAACKSQPVAMSFPFTRNRRDFIEAASKVRQQVAKKADPKNAFSALCDNNVISGKKNAKHWSDLQVFKFGVLSYLLPRYLITMGGGGSSGDVDKQLFTQQEQWTSNNQLPCRFESGVPYGNWGEVCEDVANHQWKVAVLPSQATCARWLPNLEKTVATPFQYEIYGVQLRGDDDEGQNNAWEIYDMSANGSGGKSNNSASGNNFALNRMTIVDGWGEEFYYYSLPPHQSYTLWSGGPNKKTFPPWVDLKEVEQKNLKTIQDWVADDIMQMSN